MMDWKRVLRQDLATILRGGKAPHEKYDDGEVTWPGPTYVRAQDRLEDLLSVTYQLIAIVRCNATLAGGVEAATKDAPTPRLAAVLAALRDDLAAGFGLSEAMARRPRFYPRYYVDLVSAGERTGKLGEALIELSKLLAARQEFGDVMANYLFYVLSVFVVLLGMTVFLAVFLIPHLAMVLEEVGSEPPWQIRLFIDAAAAMKTLWPLYVVAFCAVAIAMKIALLVAKRVSRNQRVLSGLLQRTPVLGQLFTQSQLGHVAAILERLLGGGVPLDEALESAAASGVAPFYADALRRVKGRVEGGATFTEALGKEPSIPEFFRGFASLGESSGMMEQALGRVADTYRRQVSRTAKIVLDVVTPLGIVVLGLIAVFVTTPIFAFLVSLMDAVANAT